MARPLRGRAQTCGLLHDPASQDNDVISAYRIRTSVSASLRSVLTEGPPDLQHLCVRTLRSLLQKQLDRFRSRTYKKSRCLGHLHFLYRCDWIRTSGLCVPNAALYQTEPRIDLLKGRAISPSPYSIFDYIVLVLQSQQLNSFLMD